MSDTEKRFIYLRGRGAIAIAYTVSGEGDLREVEYSLALCSPKDQFSRKIARTIAANRLDAGYVGFKGRNSTLRFENGKFSFQFIRGQQAVTGGLFRQVTRATIGHLVNSNDVVTAFPGWASDIMSAIEITDEAPAVTAAAVPVS